MTTDELKTAFEDAEADSVALVNEKDAAIAKVNKYYRPRIQKANQKAADAQKKWCDAMAVDALLDRPDGAAVANALGLEFPDPVDV